MNASRLDQTLPAEVLVKQSFEAIKGVRVDRRSRTTEQQLDLCRRARHRCLPRLVEEAGIIGLAHITLRSRQEARILFVKTSGYGIALYVCSLACRTTSTRPNNGSSGMATCNSCLAWVVSATKRATSTSRLSAKAIGEPEPVSSNTRWAKSRKRVPRLLPILSGLLMR